MHELFELLEEEEDSTISRQCFHDLLSDNSLKIMMIVNRQLSKILFRYCNKQMMNSVFTPKSDKSKEEIE